MLVRLIVAVAICGMAGMPARAIGLSAQLFPLTGEVRLLNKNDSAVPFVFYSIDSPIGALNSSPAVWKSVTNHYDQPSGPTPGNGLVDPNGHWVPIESSATQLAEGALDADGGMLPAFRAISLGTIWDPYLVAFPDLVFDIRDDVNSIPVTIELALDGDYSSDQVVDQGDYIVWRKYLDSLEAWFADGDLDGVVDIDDRLVWQENFGVTLPLPPYASGEGGGSGVSAGTVPEPSSIVVTLLAGGILPVMVKRRAGTR